MYISTNVCIYGLSLPSAGTHTTHEETKNTWARDDPAILILMAGGMFGMPFLVLPQLSLSTSDIIVAAALAWSVIWSYGLYETVRLVFLMIFRDFLLVGVISATLLWWGFHARHTCHY
jgi:hypothetical protein